MMAGARIPTKLVFTKDVTAEFPRNFKPEMNVNFMWTRVKKNQYVKTMASVLRRWGIGIVIAQIIITESNANITTTVSMYVKLNYLFIYVYRTRLQHTTQVDIVRQKKTITF